MESESDELYTAWIWRLPIKGSKVSVRTDFVEYRHLHIAPVRGIVTLARDLMHLEVTEAELCGISFPLVVDATTGGPVRFNRITARNLGIQKTSRCISGERLSLIRPL